MFYFRNFLHSALAIVLCLISAYAVASAEPTHAAILRNGVNDMVSIYESQGEHAAAECAKTRHVRPRIHNNETLYPLIIELNAGVTQHSFDTAWLTSHGIIVDAVSATHARVLVPLNRMRTLSEHPQIHALSVPAVPMALSYGMGTKISEAVTETEAASLQQTKSITGAGVKVAVIDVGFIGLANAITNGELPSSTVKVNLPGTNDDSLESVTQHGVAVAEEVMDMAPGATLYCIMIGDEVDLENAAAYLKSNDIHIANHSVGWFNDGGYYNDSGTISTIVNKSHDSSNVFWAVAAGNSAQTHWRGTWSDPDNDSILNVTADSESILLTASTSTEDYIYLNWNQYANPVTDLDLYVYDKNGLVVASSTNNQATTQDPSEYVAFTWSASLSPYKVVIRRKSGPITNLDMTLFCPENTMTHAVARSSVCSPADAHGAFAVAAINESVWNTTSPIIEYFSSRGPTTDGRIKPDIAAPNRTTTLTYGDSAAIGTSFSSPVVAGAAALLMQRYPSITAAAISDTLKALARDVGPTGKDTAYGSGLLYVWLPPPVLALPGAGAIGVPLTPTLSWSSAAWASSYRVQVASASTFSTQNVDDSTLTVASKAVSSLAPATQWYWRAQARKTSGASAWSDTWSFTTLDSFKLALEKGWSLISFNVHPLDSSSSTIFNTLSHLVVAKTMDGLIYGPAYNVKTLSTLNVTRGYEVYVSAADTLHIAAASQVVPSVTPITLSTGWNLISYLPSAGMSPVTAFADIVGTIVIVKNNNGNIYCPLYNVTTIDSLLPGDGYCIYTTTALSFTYPTLSEKRPAANKCLRLPTSQHFCGIKKTGRNATLLIPAVTINGHNAPDNSEVGVFDSTGLLVGSGVVKNGVTVCTVWGDDPETAEKDGCINNEKLTCKLWSNNSLSALAFSKTSSMAVYNDNAILTASLNAQHTTAPVKLAFSGAYPNPFTKNIRIGFTVPAASGTSLNNVTISVYTLNGVLVSKLVNGTYAAGYHTVSWNAGSFGANMYVAVMKSGTLCAKMRLFKVQ